MAKSSKLQTENILKREAIKFQNLKDREERLRSKNSSGAYKKAN